MNSRKGEAIGWRSLLRYIPTALLFGFVFQAGIIFNTISNAADERKANKTAIAKNSDKRGMEFRAIQKEMNGYNRAIGVLEKSAELAQKQRDRIIRLLEKK
jgi:hypothetical protein|tara:strand:- start:2174 stop:2476 length:303 start_codon:yes stop_codon:yes gene_type:complete